MSAKENASPLLDATVASKAETRSSPKIQKEQTAANAEDDGSSRADDMTSSPSSSGVFNERNFVAKLENVIPTQESIQSLGLWIIHHKGNHEAICRIWIDKLNESSVSCKQKLALFYLANEVIQNCRRKNAKIFQQTFRTYLLRAIEIVGREDSIVKSVERVLDVWLERSVYDVEFVNKLLSKLQEEKSKILKSPPRDEPSHHQSTNNPKVFLSTKSVDKTAPGHMSLDKSSIEEIIEEFRVKNLCESLADFQKVAKKTNLEKARVESTRILDVSSESVKQYRDKTQCCKFKTDFENSSIHLENFLNMLENMSKQRAELVNLLEKSEIFYEAQFNDAKKVNNVYRIYASKVSTMKKKLEDYVNEKFENKQISDMEMSEDESKEAGPSGSHELRSNSVEYRMSGSIRVHLDPRQNRNSSFDSNRKLDTGNQHESKSNRSSHSKSSSSSTSSSNSSSSQKRKKESSRNDDLSVERKQSGHDQDPFDFLSKLINKSSSGPDTLPSGSSASGESSNNLSFLVSSLQKFVNSGSSSNPSNAQQNTLHTTQMQHQEQKPLEYAAAAGSYYEEQPYLIGSSPYMLMNGPPPPPPPPPAIGSYYHSQPSTSAGPLAPLTIPTTHYHPHQFYPINSPVGAHPHQLMEIDTHQYAPQQIGYGTSGDPSIGMPSPNSPAFKSQSQISPLMTVKSEEFRLATLGDSQQDFNDYHQSRVQDQNHSHDKSRYIGEPGFERNKMKNDFHNFRSFESKRPYHNNSNNVSRQKSFEMDQASGFGRNYQSNRNNISGGSPYQRVKEPRESWYHNSNQSRSSQGRVNDKPYTSRSDKLNKSS